MKNLSTARISHLLDYDPLLLLNLRRLPGRVSVRGAAALLNFEPVAIRTLIALRLLKPRTGKCHRGLFVKIQKAGINRPFTLTV